MEQHLTCRLVQNPNREEFQIKFHRRFTPDPDRFRAICARFESQLGIRTRVSTGDGTLWIIPYSWFRHAVPTSARIVQVLTGVFSQILSINLLVEVEEQARVPVPDFDPTMEDQDDGQYFDPVTGEPAAPPNPEQRT